MSCVVRKRSHLIWVRCVGVACRRHSLLTKSFGAEWKGSGESAIALPMKDCRVQNGEGVEEMRSHFTVKLQKIIYSLW
ncbi:hypothetical protein [Argonema antarcticum]|uniref:hypothetical protein n=1 Tax=Argonema antarcticum TaxID=2942763 RepID=UPI002011B78D|nr:hypothetical protein [Argonema antarcticum]MCL1475179.1 hypothetical protein [Argonema antarcticum A004/B2]